MAVWRVVISAASRAANSAVLVVTMDGTMAGELVALWAAKSAVSAATMVVLVGKMAD
jgi:hypothetical protein